MSTESDAGLWQNWEGKSDAVVSTRLGADVPTANKHFPKVRSWLALGAPMELLSPLSVLRIIYPLLVLVLTLDASVDIYHHTNRLWLDYSVVTVAVTVWVCLIRAKTLRARTSQQLWFLAATLVALGVWAGTAMSPFELATDFATVITLVPITALAALFFGPRVIAQFLAADMFGLWVAFEPGMGKLDGLFACFIGGLCIGIAILLIGLLTRGNRRMGTIDPDTGLPNGLGLADVLATDPDQPRIVASVMLGGIAEAREALGYRVGTELLRRAVEDLGQSLPTGATIGRVGGDQVIVIMPLRRDTDQPSDLVAAHEEPMPGSVLEEAMLLAGKLNRTVSAGRYAVGSIELSLRAHIGIAVSPWHGKETADLVRYSAFAAERSNDIGQSVTVFDRAHRKLTPDDLALLSDLRTAAEDGHLWLAYQPQIEAQTGHAVGVEALIRWNHPVHGFVSPGEFIPLAERTGLIDRITEWVLNEALDAQVRWRAQGIEAPVSVNVSARSLNRPDLSALILEALRSRELPTSALTVEVTETAATPDLLLAINLLRPLHDNGVRVSIDDFGTGYTSLSLLPSLPLDELKVDQGFIQRSATSAADEAIVRSVRELAHRLGLTAVAEGVEDAPLNQQIVDLGFDIIQGYFHAKPMPEAAVLEYLHEHVFITSGITLTL